MITLQSTGLGLVERYLELGWRLFPVAGKRPLTPRGFYDATADAGQLRAWLEAHEGCGWAVATGGASGVVVLDVDPAHHGTASLRELVAVHGMFPRTPLARTGSGGWHYYFRHPGREVRNSAGRLGRGLDVRGDGGYVVLPPSGHPTGGRYEWVISPWEAELQPMPEWLDAERPRARQVLSTLPRIPHGQRNVVLTSVAGYLRRIGLSEAAIDAALQVTNAERCDPPLPEEEVRRIAGSVARYEPEYDLVRRAP